MGSDLRENLLQAAERVNRLRRELAEAEREVDTLLSGMTSKHAGFAPKGSLVAWSVPARILERMRDEPLKTFSAGDFKDLATSSNYLQNVRTALARLTNLKKLERSGRGHYHLRVAYELD